MLRKKESKTEPNTHTPSAVTTKSGLILHSWLSPTVKKEQHEEHRQADDSKQSTNEDWHLQFSYYAEQVNINSRPQRKDRRAWYTIAFQVDMCKAKDSG